TEFIIEINRIINTLIKKERKICISRPRRFGKTKIVDMLSAYYSYKESKITSFMDKKISKSENWDKYLGSFNVIKLNMFIFFIKQV
ncbi:hypothetical protein BCR36DRAFT_307644, partial [Piromyces finnis]